MNILHSLRVWQLVLFLADRDIFFPQLMGALEVWQFSSSAWWVAVFWAASQRGTGATRCCLRRARRSPECASGGRMAVKLRMNPIGKSAASCTVGTSYGSGYHLGTRGLTRSQTGRKNHITCLKPQKKWGCSWQNDSVWFTRTGFKPTRQFFQMFYRGFWLLEDRRLIPLGFVVTQRHQICWEGLFSSHGPLISAQMQNTYQD